MMCRHNEKEANFKGVIKSMDTTNMLELADLYLCMGDTQKAKEIIHSTHCEMMKPVEEIKPSESDSSKVEGVPSGEELVGGTCNFVLFSYKLGMKWSQDTGNDMISEMIRRTLCMSRCQQYAA
jgi:hypothetical protein